MRPSHSPRIQLTPEQVKIFKKMWRNPQLLVLDIQKKFGLEHITAQVVSNYARNTHGLPSKQGIKKADAEQKMAKKKKSAQDKLAMQQKVDSKHPKTYKNAKGITLPFVTGCA